MRPIVRFLNIQYIALQGSQCSQKGSTLYFREVLPSLGSSLKCSSKLHLETIGFSISNTSLPPAPPQEIIVSSELQGH